MVFRKLFRPTLFGLLHDVFKAPRWHTKRTSAHRRAYGISGQSTVEFCVVFVALLGLLYAGYELYIFVRSGAFVAHAEASAPYALAQNTFGALADIFIH